MNPLWHIFWTYVIFRRKKYFKKTLVSSFVPDIISLVVLGTAILTRNASYLAFKTTYIKNFSGFTEISIALHSLAIFSIVLAVVLLFRWWYLIPFFYGWILHIILDTFTHASDNYPLLWPFSAYIFKSGISYWEIEHDALPLNIINLVLAAIAILHITKDTLNKKFEIPFFLFVLLGIIASFLFIITNRSFLTPLFVIANVITVSALVYALYRHRAQIRNY